MHGRAVEAKEAPRSRVWAPSSTLLQGYQRSAVDTRSLRGKPGLKCPLTFDLCIVLWLQPPLPPQLPMRRHGRRLIAPTRKRGETTERRTRVTRASTPPRAPPCQPRPQHSPRRGGATWTWHCPGRPLERQGTPFSGSSLLQQVAPLSRSP